MADNFIYWEDLEVGQRYSAGPVTVTAEMIVDFARLYDPQDFHLDAEKAKDTPFGELVASGWMTASLGMRMILEAMPKMKGGMIGRRVERMNWPRPVRPGDTLSLTVEITGKREMPGKKDRSTFTTHQVLHNQKGEVVFEQETLVFAPRRPA